MFGSMVKTALATVGFGLLHSALASRAAKEAAAGVVGERARRGLYRPLYLVQSVGTTLALGAYIRSLPDVEIYRARGPLRWLMRAGQGASLAAMAWAAHEVGVGQLTGAEGLQAWAGGASDVPAGVEAQGPTPEGDHMHADGPFRISRHPLNALGLPVLWLNPTMTTNLLAFNLVATAYLVLGSLHEESRLRDAYGPAYERYRRSDVPFFLPAPAPHEAHAG